MSRSAVIYCRISRDKVGAGLGVDRQLEDCTGLAARLGWSVVSVHTDNDLTAYSGKRRPGYEALLEDLHSRRADAVIAWHTDRLHRSPLELEAYITACEPREVPTHCVKAGPLDLSTASGRLVARQLGAVARYEVEHQIERSRSQKLHAAKAGKYRGGRRPFGYESDGVTVVKDEAELVRDACERVLIGESLASVAREWTAQGVLQSTWHPPLAIRPWDSVTLKAVLIRARNAAIIVAGGVEYPACWPAIVGLHMWRAVTALLTDPSRSTTRSRVPVWLGSSLFRCGVCDDGMTVRSAVSGGGNSRGRHGCYRCKKHGHLVRAAAPVDATIAKLVIDRLSKPDAHLLLARHTAVDLGAMSAERSALKARLNQLSKMFTRGKITEEQLESGTDDVRQRITEIDGELVAATAGSPLAGFADAEDVSAAWSDASISRRKAVIGALMVVTLLPSRPGRQPGGDYYDPDAVRVDWRVAP